MATADLSNSDLQTSAISPTTPKFIHGTFKGEPAVTIPHQIEESLAAKFQTTLVGKFSQGKPGMDSIRRFTALQNFKGTVLLGLIDKKHVLLRFELTEDYVRCFSRSIWNVEGKLMRILKWTSNFRVDRESSIIPIWLSLPMLPIHLVNEEFIFSLVSSFCKPLRIDSATELLKRPSVARVQVEFDILDMLPSRIWVQSENGTGFWQSVEIEETLPFYCTYCWHIGHHEQFCTVKHPELHPSVHKTDISTHKEYRRKHQQANVTDQLGPAATSVQATMETAAPSGAPIAAPFSHELVTIQQVPGLGEQQKQLIATVQLISEKEQLIASFGEQKGPTEIEENCQLQDIAAISNSSPEQQPRTEDELALPAPLYSVQEKSLMISTAQQSTSSKNQTFKSSKAGSPILSSQKYKGMENVNEDGMVTKTNSAAHSYGKIRGSSEALTTKNSFDMLSELDTTHSPQLTVNDIETELQFLNLDGPNVRRTGYTSEKDSKVKLTPDQRIRRTRKKTKIFDL